MHQKALSTTATLEEEIEKLHQMKVHSWPELKPRGRDRQRLEERRKKRCHQVSFSSEPTPSQSANPDTPSGKMRSEGGDSDSGELAKLKAEIVSFLHSSSKTLEGEDEEMIPELPMLKSADWVHWKAEKCDTPSWWMELSTVPGEDTGRLAQEVRALFQLPRHMPELDHREAPFHVPPALPCLHWWRFMPLAMSIFASWDIREIPRENVVAYARALQYFMEQNNPPKGDEPCLLAESIVKLRREVRFYLSFMDEEVFWGVALP